MQRRLRQKYQLFDPPSLLNNVQKEGAFWKASLSLISFIMCLLEDE